MEAAAGSCRAPFPAWWGLALAVLAACEAGWEEGGTGKARPPPAWGGGGEGPAWPP